MKAKALAKRPMAARSIFASSIWEPPKHQPVSLRRSVSGVVEPAERLNSPDRAYLAVTGAAGKKTLAHPRRMWGSWDPLTEARVRPLEERLVSRDDRRKGSRRAGRSSVGGLTDGKSWYSMGAVHPCGATRTKPIAKSIFEGVVRCEPAAQQSRSAAGTRRCPLL